MEKRCRVDPDIHIMKHSMATCFKGASACDCSASCRFARGSLARATLLESTYGWSKQRRVGVGGLEPGLQLLTRWTHWAATTEAQQ